jgi:hypothetical protein
MNMKFVRLCIGILLIIAMVMSPVMAAANEHANENANQDKPSVIIEYGKGREAGLIKVTHIHYARPNSRVRPPKVTPCYTLTGYKWATPVTYTINTSYGLSSGFIISAIEISNYEWDSETSKVLFADTAVGAYPWKVYDGKNSVSFGNYDTSGVIAVTVTWYNRFTRVAVESDILFDTDYAWGDATVVSGVMDLQNIATHEIGHTIGLGDMYDGVCSAVTMFGYSGYGDVEKRTLEQPDITGLQKIYGA